MLAAMRTHRLRRAVAALLGMLLALPDPVLAHVRLESSTPARDAVVTTSPPLLHLKFSAHIEQRYTQIALIALHAILAAFRPAD